MRYAIFDSMGRQATAQYTNRFDPQMLREFSALEAEREERDTGLSYAVGSIHPDGRVTY